MGNLRLITAAGMAVFATAEAVAVDMHDWVSRCQYRTDLCEPAQKPLLDRGRGTLVNTIGIAASPNAIVEISQAVSTGNTVHKVSLEGGVWFGTR